MNSISGFVKLLIFVIICHFQANAQIDLSRASIYAVPGSDGISKTILIEEVQSRTALRIPSAEKYPTVAGQTLVLCLEADLLKLPVPVQNQYQALPQIGDEGFKLFYNPETRSMVVAGKDGRGLLYGVGRFLRKAALSSGRMIWPELLQIASTPAYSVRGHQLGYRPKTNSYDAFSVKQFDQYIRELALFGANSIEIMPPRTDDDPTSRHMKLPAMEMMREQSVIAQKYGLDVWMWYPNLEKDYSDPETIRRELLERESVFREVPKLNAVFVPGGDPGDLEPDELFAWLQQVASRLKKYHPQAKIWISPQSFRPDKQWFDAFFQQANQGYTWLGGIVFGPWVKITIEEIRARLNADIPIRNYPDITHSLACQYPVPDWDKAWAVTLGREAVNPRPADQKIFHNRIAPFCIGSISYSEGTNDDVNKFIWSDQDWDPGMDVTETLRDYSRLFFGPEWAEEGARAILALEENNRGALLGKSEVLQTLQQWQSMEKRGGEKFYGNPRFQMGLIRAYFDAYTRERLINETYLENKAREVLENADAKNLDNQIAQAGMFLQAGWLSPVRIEWKQKCIDLADSLYQSIGAQLTIDKHGAMPGRGNFIDQIQYPLTDAPWLLSKLDQIATLNSSEEKLREIYQLLHRTDPGPGGFYDHLASPESRHRIVSKATWAEDPGSLISPRTGFGLSLPDDSWFKDIPGAGRKIPLVPANWNNQIEAIYDTPLQVVYDNLETNVVYRVRVVYTGRFKSHLKLEADGILVHNYLKVGTQPVYEMDLPLAATRDGKITLTWTCKEAERGSQVAEVWLIKSTAQ